ncbi:MAG: M15 family metallopeptidase [Chloroherpetonaceae bacterium]|nr:M15 family metallopeptidase [Chloroherpetonaceae bacterium]
MRSGNHTALIDNLTYNYVNGRNQLTHITDAATGSNSNEGVRTGQLSNNYAYDGNGNLIRDNSKNISNIEYDWRNLPTTITFSTTPASQLTYRYNADGARIEKAFTVGGNTTRTEYEYGAGGNLIAVYENLATSPTFYYNEVGYLRRSDNVRFYYLKDQLGNNRATFSDSAGITFTEFNDFFAYGAPRQSWFRSGDGRWKFLGLELDNETGSTHTNARELFNFEGVFNRPDRFDYKYPHLSPYIYGAQNPFKFSDTSGDSLIKVLIDDKSGFIHGKTEVVIDHTILEDFTNLLNLAVQTETHIHINDSFRSNEDQENVKPTGKVKKAVVGNSTHNAGIAIDFNVYIDNKVENGKLQGNDGLTDDNKFIKGAKEQGWRWGGDFKDNYDPVHVDKKDVSTEGLKAFKDMVTQNQKQNKVGISTTIKKEINKKEKK